MEGQVLDHDHYFNHLFYLEYAVTLLCNLHLVDKKKVSKSFLLVPHLLPI